MMVILLKIMTLNSVLYRYLVVIRKSLNVSSLVLVFVIATCLRRTDKTFNYQIIMHAQDILFSSGPPVIRLFFTLNKLGYC